METTSGEADKHYVFERASTALVLRTCETAFGIVGLHTNNVLSCLNAVGCSRTVALWVLPYVERKLGFARNARMPQTVNDRLQTTTVTGVEPVLQALWDGCRTVSLRNSNCRTAMGTD